MKRNVNQKVCILLAICMMLSIFCNGAIAFEESSPYLSSYSADVIAKSSGKLVVNVFVDGVYNVATQVGSTLIILYESPDGRNYSEVARYYATDYPAMMESGDYYDADPVSYWGVPGYYYYAVVYIYAGDNTGYTERRYTTSVVRAHN